MTRWAWLVVAWVSSWTARRALPVAWPFYEELAGRLYGLPIGLDDRIDSEQAQLLHHFIDIGEYGLALEEIAGTLAQAAIAITDHERAGILALAARMNLEDDLVPRALAACPEIGGRERR